MARVGFKRASSYPETNAEKEEAAENVNKRLKNDENSPPTTPTEESEKGRLKSETSKSTSITPAVRKLFVKSPSDPTLTTCKVKSALDRIDNNPNLIGDASKPHILPVKENGKHRDLKEISIETLAKLLGPDKDDSQEKINFKIIDCRYPYEFDGGHIRGALNLYTKSQIKEQLLDSKITLSSSQSSDGPEKENISTENREILIFHCEFSSRRGPFLYRYLRDIDRSFNMSCYPYLLYPEIYLLHGGYKAFFEKFPQFCDPARYVEMSDPEHADQFRRFKSETKMAAQQSSTP